MGTGKPEFGVYGQAYNNRTHVILLREATINFPYGCPYLTLSPTTMGADAYKAAISILITAKTTKTAVRFYAHQDRDEGCGVDYIQLL
jgi:hypothetical protein